ncbi:CAZyme family GT90 [Paecilomyces variotii]|nr:CAZyme family GT90 [Paecilomyces variotii]
MRLQRLVVLLGVITLVGLSIILIKGPSAVESSFDFTGSEPFENSLPPNFKSLLPPPSEKSHPIAKLIEDGDAKFSAQRSRQSSTLEEAVQEYRRRYRMYPPPHFDKWFEFAKRHDVQIIDDYDTIYNSLLPFWALDPKTIRDRARETLGFDNAMIGLLIRNGKVTKVEGGGDGRKWQRDATVHMMEKFIEYLPDMDLVFNTHDEPRVILANEDLQRLVNIATNRIEVSASKNVPPRNSWSSRPADVNKGDRIEEVRTTRFNRFAHQPTWTNSRISCPVDSPARSLDENQSDNVTAYGYGELGFIYNTTAFSDICLSPSLRNTFGFFDRPNAFDIVHDLFPVFSQSKISSFQDILYPSPWYWIEKVPYEARKDFDWDAKKDKLYWRGSTTGGFSRGGGWRRQHRQQFVKKINAPDTTLVLEKNEEDRWAAKRIRRRDYSDWFDVKFTFIGQCDPDDCAAQREFFEVVKPAGQQDAWAYKYLVDIDGNAFSGRYYAFLLSNSLVYKLSVFREWHDEWLKPWVHYVPLSTNGDEYVESVRYFIAEEEGRIQGPRLAKQGKEWAEKALRNIDLEAWFFRLLLEYGRLVDDNRDNLGFSV